VLLCDRGTLDGSAYISKEMWDRLLRAKGLDPLRIREGRYDAVFHLVTAALGAESYYSLMNNATRTESPEFAREVGESLARSCVCGYGQGRTERKNERTNERTNAPSSHHPHQPQPHNTQKVDVKTQGVWNGHPRHFVIDNSTDFEGKLARVQAQAARLVGLPAVPKGADRWFLKSKPDFSRFTVPYETTRVRKVHSINGVDRNRCRWLADREEERGGPPHPHP